MLTALRDYCWQIDLGSVNAYLVSDLADPGLSSPTVPATAGTGGGRPPTADAVDVGDETEATVDVGEGTLTLVDAGTPSDAGTIVRAIGEAGFSIGDIERVLVTHYDVDHVGGLSGLVDRGLDATVYVGSPDADYVAGRATIPVEGARSALSRLAGVLVRPPNLRVEAVADGDAIGSFTVYHTPGHTEGHVAYVGEALSVGFVGDLVRESESRLEPSPSHVSVDADAVHESIHDLADRAPAVEVLGPGHGVPFLRNGSVRLAELGQRIE